MDDVNRRAGLLLRALACLTVVAVAAQTIIDVTGPGRSVTMMVIPAIVWPLIALILSAKINRGDIP